jgi:hypothetical protein
MAASGTAFRARDLILDGRQSTGLGIPDEVYIVILEKKHLSMRRTSLTHNEVW